MRNSVKLKEISIIYFALLERNLKGDFVKTISPMGLKENNIIEIVEDYVIPNKSGLAQSNDIIIKRVSPNYVNVLGHIDEEIYLFNNTVAVRLIDDKYDACYIALIIEQNLKSFNSKSNNGTRFPAVNRKMIEEIAVPTQPITKQKQIGELWYLQNKQQNIKKQLMEKERLKSKMVYSKLSSTLEGN